MSALPRRSPNYYGPANDAGRRESQREMRDWILEKMRRRSRRGPNESESTGKSGQELPSGQLAPLRPSYPDPIIREEKPEISRTSELPVELGPPPADFKPASDSEKMVVETQPDSLATPPAEQVAA